MILAISYALPLVKKPTSKRWEEVQRRMDGGRKNMARSGFQQDGIIVIICFEVLRESLIIEECTMTMYLWYLILDLAKQLLLQPICSNK
jgi:hypothetical protein